VVIRLEQSANDLDMVQLMPLPPIISDFIRIQNDPAFLVPAYPDCPGQRQYPLSTTTRVSLYQKCKANLDLLEQKIVSGRGISWALYKSAPHPRQTTTPAPHHSVFTCQMPFLLSNQECQSTEGC